MKLSSNVIGDSNDENNFPHKLLLTNAQVSKLPEAFANCLSANLKSSKTQLHEIGQSRGFLGTILEPLLKTELLLIKNLFNLFAESVLIQLGLPARVSATDAAIHKKRYESGMTTLIICNKEMSNVIKMVKS